MIAESTSVPRRLGLWPGQDEQAPVGAAAWLTLHLLPGERTRPCVLICPGGGYGALAAHEGEDIAAWLNGVGFHAAVLAYRLGSAGHHHPAMIHDAQRAMRLLRHHADAWRVRSDAIAVLGFSAGGHLASTLAVHHQRFHHDADDLAGLDAAPNAAVLCYPVIDLATSVAHSGSRSNLLGPRCDDAELRELLSTDRHVGPQTPPTFLWHTATDAGVPAANSLRFASACLAAGVPVELHVFEQGKHGLGLATGPRAMPDVAVWADLCVRFLRRHLDTEARAGL